MQHVPVCLVPTSVEEGLVAFLVNHSAHHTVTNQKIIYVQEKKYLCYLAEGPVTNTICTQKESFFFTCWDTD